jgi:chromosome segregation ATPase
LAAVSARAAQADQQLNDLAAESQLLAGAKQEQAAMLLVLHERSDAERHATRRALEELEHERREGARLQLSLRTAEVDADALRKRLDGMEEELRRESHALQQCRRDLQVHVAAATSLRDRLERSESALADCKHERDELRQVR